MTASFPQLVADYVDVVTHPHSAAQHYYDAAMRLPQTPARRDDIARADGIVRAAYAATQWTDSIATAASTLTTLLERDEHPNRIHHTARELLHLLGEDPTP